MKTLRKTFLVLGLAAVGAVQTEAAVKITALQMISTDENGKIQGVGAHRFKTTNHGGQPCLYLIEGDNLNGTISNGPGAAQNGVNLTLSVGTHTYTIYAENANAYSWNNYTLNLHFDNSNSAQVSLLAPLNSNSTLFFPPSVPNAEFTEDLQGHSVKALNTREYKSGATVVKVTDFHISAPILFNKDRISPFEAKSDGKPDYIGQFTVEVTAPPQIAAGGVVNAASYAAKVAPGSLFSIFGTDLATANQSAASAPLPTSLGGTSVTIGGKPAPLVFVSPGQINAQIPYEAVLGETVPVIVTVNGVASPVGNVSVVAAAPGIFQFGEKRAVVQNADYSVNTAENGAAPDSFVIAYLTGAGEVDNAVRNGYDCGELSAGTAQGKCDGRDQRNHDGDRIRRIDTSVHRSDPGESEDSESARRDVPTRHISQWPGQCSRDDHSQVI